jgi:hypothetical protein
MQATPKWEIADTLYPATRLSLEHNTEQINDQQLEQYLETLFPGASAEDVESLMRNLQRFGRSAAPLAQRALPGIIQGAVTGATVAGPWGALAGAVGGGAVSLLSKPSPTQPASPSPVPSPTGRPASLNVSPPPVTPIAPTPNVTPSAPNSNLEPIRLLMALLARPETMQALSALLMSSSGRRAIRVGEQSIPSAAFANAISELAADVAELAMVPNAESLSSYLVDSVGQPRCDIANSNERAHVLVQEVLALSYREMQEDEVYVEQYLSERAEFEESMSFLAENWEDEDDDFEDPLEDYNQALMGATSS